LFLFPRTFPLVFFFISPLPSPRETIFSFCVPPKSFCFRRSFLKPHVNDSPPLYPFHTRLSLAQLNFFANLSTPWCFLGFSFIPPPFSLPNLPFSSGRVDEGPKLLQVPADCTLPTPPYLLSCLQFLFLPSCLRPSFLPSPLLPEKMSGRIHVLFSPLLSLDNHPRLTSALQFFCRVVKEFRQRPDSVFSCP